MTSPEIKQDKGLEENMTDNDGDKKERISKRLSRAGICSRREAERWIEQGRVKLNGKKLTSPVVLVGMQDKIVVDGKIVGENPDTTVWRYHKPTGLVTSNADEKGRMTIFDNLPQDFPRVMTIGRLDMNTEGLLLLTNDGELARHLEHPDTGWVRRYRVRVFGAVDEVRLKALKKGIVIDGIRYKSIDASLDKEQGDGKNTWITIGLTEGKNREIRKVMEHLDLQVNRLIRLSYGPFQLGNLPKGQVEPIKKNALKGALGKKFTL
jgi:23S rRNA pseudouridine2605 synthase